MNKFPTWLTGIMLTAALLTAYAAELSIFPVPGSTACGGAMVTTRGELPTYSPVFTLTLLPDSLELEMVLPHPPGVSIKVTGEKGRPTSIFGGETAEFMLMPDPVSDTVFHFAVNPDGRYYTALNRDSSWHPQMTCSTERNKDGWRARFLIPYQEIGSVFPAAGSHWRANFMATVHDGEMFRSMCWSRSSSFHDRSQFGTISFTREQTSEVTDWGVRDGTLFLETKSAVPLTCTVNGIPMSMAEDRRRQEYSLERGYIAPKMTYSVKVTGRTPEGKEQIIRQADLMISSRYMLTLDRFYYSAADLPPKFRHTFPLPAELVVSNAQTGQMISRIQAPNEGNLLLSSLPPGDYQVTLTSGSLRTSHFFKVVPDDFLPPALPPGEMGIRDGILLLGGQPRFAVGASSNPRPCVQFTPAFNLRAGYYALQPDSIELEGIPGFRLIRRPETGYQLADEWHEAVLRDVSRIRQPLRAIRRLAYEAQFPLFKAEDGQLQKLSSSDFYAKLYRELKQKFPRNHFSIHVDDPSVLPCFIGSCDLLEIAFWSSSFAVDMMKNLEQDMTYAKKIADSKPVIFWLGVSVPNSTCRTAEELRAAVYTTMILRGSGVIFHLGHGGISPDRTRLWSLISGINTEINQFYPEFADGAELPLFVRNCSGDFLFAARRSPDRILLAVINRSWQEQKLEMETEQGTISALFTPLEPKLFSWNAYNSPK